jgi:hypothetical protein
MDEGGGYGAYSSSQILWMALLNNSKVHPRLDRECHQESLELN